MKETSQHDSALRLPGRCSSSPETLHDRFRSGFSRYDDEKTEMTPERWQLINELYHSALERPSSERAAFVADACDGDEELRREVESLVESHDQDENFIEQPVVGAVARLIVADQTDSMVGRRIRHYEVLAQIGAGGMGEVYLAKDTKLDRQVAIKLLPDRFMLEADRVRRFQQEARAASALNHPNILTIYELEEVKNRPYIVTEFINGQTLRRLMASGRLNLGQVLDFSIQITSALAAAHEAGIIHRDIKPENIMVRADGYIKVLDFGLAKLTEREPSGIASSADTVAEINTDPGVVMGTFSYMSPEQARGLTVDARTDLWSLGVVLYEMVCGTPPFVGKTPPDVLSAILSEQQQPPPLPPEVPLLLSFFIKKALSKKRKMRYQTVQDLQNDLQRLRQEIESAAQHDHSVAESRSGEEAIGESIRKHGKAVSSSNRATSLSSKPRLRKKIDSLAVLPLANASADPNMEYLSDGITESIINSLSQLPQLKVMSRSTVFRYKSQKGRDEVNPKEVGSELNVRAVMTGRVLQFADNLIIQTELVDAVDGSQIWGEQYKRKSSDIFEVQEEISKEISDKLRIRLSGEDKKRLTKRYTQNPDAYRLYLKGRYYWNKRTLEGLEKGIEHFHQAINLDPNYALAYAGLADSYNLLGAIEHGVSPKEFMPKAREAALKALKLDDKLAEAHTSLGNVKGSSWEWQEAEIEYRRAIELNPNYATAHHWYALLLMAMERFDESLKEIRRAKELDPLSLPINLGEGWHFYLARQYDRAMEECLKTIDLEPNFGNAHACLGMVYGQNEMYEEAIAEFKISIKLAADAPLMHAALGHAYAISGKADEARQIITELVERAKRRYISPYLIAAIFTGLGEKEEAFAWLDRAYEERSEGLFWLRVEPTMDSLRSDPRFVDLMRRLNYPQ